MERETKRKAVNVIGAVVSVIVIAVVAAVLVANACGVKGYVVLSGSMEPTIRTGSLCFVDTNADYGDVETGDIIAFEVNGSMVAHRAASVTEAGIETKGDANRVSDGISTTEDNYIGSIVFWIPYAGYAVQSPAVRYAAIGIAAAVIVLTSISGMRSRKQEDMSCE